MNPIVASFCLGLMIGFLTFYLYFGEKIYGDAIDRTLQNCLLSPVNPSQLRENK